MQLKMPAAREFGWKLRDTDSSHFAIHKRDNGQFCVVLNHALLRGITTEMLYWWFLRFPNLRVRLVDVPGYEGSQVPAYLLWHPKDHYGARLSGQLGPDNTARPGAFIQIQEAMQYDKYGWQYPVDAKVKIYYVGKDGWAMGRELPVFGPVMMLRIHFKDVVQAGERVGVHYHYEVVVGVSADNFVARWINRRICREFGPDFFDAWHRHNTIEVGVFENFLPAIYSQRSDLSTLMYRCDMDPQSESSDSLSGFDRDLFDRRVQGFKAAKDPYSYQVFSSATFIDRPESA